MKKLELSNKEFAKTNSEFIEACKNAKLPPTARQASKYRSGFGKAYLSKSKTMIDSQET